MATFFLGLQLWEKMTFVLGCAIFAVFVAGVVKLWWTGRLTKKQTGLDEEKMGNEQKVKEIDLFVESTKVNNVPFGVRAIESGIEIDGIWISRSNTPVPESIRILRIGDRTSSSSAITNSAFTIHSTNSDTSQPKPLCISSVSGVGNSHCQFERSLSSESFPRPASIRLSGQRHTYKPRRSSQLRFSSYSDFQCHEETLNRLEGKTPTKSKPTTDLNNSRGTISLFTLAHSSSDTGTDNDISSGTSSESDNSNRRNEKAVKYESRQHRPMCSQTIKEFSHQARANASESIASIISADDAHYFPMQNEQASDDQTDKETFPFIAPDLSARIGHSSHSEGDPDPLSESQVPLLRRMDNSSANTPTFGTGGIHVNRTVRRVNSNFEVLPAGTFGFRAELVAMAVDETASSRPELGLKVEKNISTASTSKKRQSNKLRKKARKSWLRSLIGTHFEHD